MHDQGEANGQAADKARVTDLLAEHLPALRAFIRLHMPPAVRVQESCSDIAQSVCRELLERAECYEFDFRGERAFKNWVFTWARHKLQDRLKYYHADKRAAPGSRAYTISEADARDLARAYKTEPSPSHAALLQERMSLLEQALDRLEPADREVIGLCRLAELRRDEVGRIMGRSPGAVRSLLNRALARLSTELGALGVD